MSTQEQLDRYKKFLDADPENMHLIKQTADLAYQLGSFEQALAISTQGIAIQPVDREIRAIQALANMALGQCTAAQLQLKSLVDEGEQNHAVRYNLAYCYALNRQFTEVLELLSDAEEEYMNIPQMVHLKIQALHHLAEIEKAIELAKQVVENHPDDAVVHGMLSSLFIDDSDFELAKLHAEQAIKLRGANHDAYTSLGTLALSEQDDSHALEYFGQAIQLKSNNGRAWLGKAMSEMLQGKLEQAQLSFNNALTHMPSHLGTWQALVWCKIAQQDLEGAESTINEALQIDDTFSENHGTLAIIQILKGNLDLAQTSIRRALRLDRKSFSGLYAQALMLKQQGQVDTSDKLIEGLLDQPLMPDQRSLRQVLVKQMAKH